MGDFDWLDVQPGKLTGLEQRAKIMRDGAMKGKDRVWWTDGDYVFFRRKKSNPTTLARHNRFVAKGDYKHVETQGDVEIYELQESSPFKPKKTIDIGMMDNYNIRRQAAQAACRRDFKTFLDIMTYLRERIAAQHRSPGRADMTPLAENIYAEQYIAVMQSIKMRQGPSPEEINRELFALQQNSPAAKGRVITVGA